jgi:hypothetical protein
VSTPYARAVDTASRADATANGRPERRIVTDRNGTEEEHMNLRRNLAAGGVAASLMASLFAISMAGPAMAATVPPVPTTVTPVGATTYVPIAVVTASGTTDIPAGTLTLSLPAGFSWAIGGAITTVESGGTLAVSGGTITVGGTTATFSVTGAAVAGSTITFSSAPVTTTTAGASGDVVLSGLSNPTSVVVARVHAPEGAATANSQAKGNDNAKGNDHAKGNAQAKGHGARKVAFYSSPAYTCPTGAQPVAHSATFGFAILNTTGHNRLNVNVVLKGALKNATYDVWVNQDPGACPLTAATKVGAIHTNARGNGTANLRVTIVSGAKNFWVSATSGSTVLRTPAATLKIKH